MAETTLQKYRRRNPQFSNATTYPDVIIDGWLGDATAFLCADSFGMQYEAAVIKYAAHLQAVAELSALMASGGPGAVFGYAGLASGVKEGDLSVNLKAGSGNAQARTLTDDFLAMTIYGREYMMIRDSVVPRMRRVGTRIRTITGFYP